MRALLLAAATIGPTAIAGSARADAVEACVEAASQGQAAKRSSALLKAKKHLIVCAREACPKVIRTDCVKWLEEVDGRLPTVSLRVTTEDAHDVMNPQITIDGTPMGAPYAGQSIELDPGSHTFRASVDGFEPADVTVILVEGEKARVVPLVLRRKAASAALRTETGRADPSSPPPNDDTGERTRPSPILVYGLGGLGVAALGSFAFFGLTGRADANDLREGCGKTVSCKESEVDDVATKYLIADVSLVVGVVALGTATVLWLIGER